MGQLQVVNCLCWRKFENSKSQNGTALRKTGTAANLWYQSTKILHTLSHKCLKYMCIKSDCKNINQGLRYLTFTALSLFILTVPIYTRDYKDNHKNKLVQKNCFFFIWFQILFFINFFSITIWSINHKTHANYLSN